MTPADDPRIGSYLVGRRLGGGGMGVVHEAVDTTLQRRVALKLISPQLALDPAFRARFTREAQVQASLDSPHVVAVHAHGEADGRLYIATQLIPDGDLGERLVRDGTPPTRAAIDLVAQVASGLADAHAAGLVHRDIKPANVLLRRRGEGFQAYLADFGIARLVDGDDPQTAHVMGTTSYMAPELHTGASAGPASDIYSLGCLLWATLTGGPPFTGGSDFQVVTAHHEQPVPQLDASVPLSAGVNEVLRCSMAKDPAQRYPSAAAMQAALRRLTSPQQAAPPAPASQPPAPQPPTRRSRMAVTLVGVSVALCVIALGAAYVVTRDGGRAPRTATGPGRTLTPSPISSPSPSVSPSPLSPSPSPSPSPRSPSPSPTVPAGDAETAAASMGAALAGQLGVSSEQGTCVARATIDQVGLPRLVEIGFFTPDLVFADLELGPYPEVKTALTSATLTCLTVPS